MMKKRFLPIILTLVLLVAVCAIGVSASEAKAAKQTWSHLSVSADGQTATGYCPHCCTGIAQTVTWKRFVRGTAHNYLTTSGHYFLGESSVDDGAFRPNAKGLAVSPAYW